jgi:hypothetical protein
MGSRRFIVIYMVMVRFIANAWDLLELLPHKDGELRSKRRAYCTCSRST